MPIQSIIQGFRREHHLTEWEICYILGLKEADLSHEAIGLKVGRDRSTITKILQRYDWSTWSGKPVRSAPRCKTTDRDDRQLVRAALSNRVTVLRDISNIANVSISPRTVQRRLKENNIQKHIAVAKPFLTPVHQEARYSGHWNIRIGLLSNG
jgi:IS30 family transposase